MRGRTILISLAAIFTVILVSSTVFVSGVLDASKISLFYTPIGPDQAGGTVFVDPDKIIKDYINDPGYQIGDTIGVHVNISGVATGIFTYAVNLTWNPAVLSFSGIASYGDFLDQTASIYGTSRIEDTYFADNVVGTASVAETILGDYPGVTGQGRLFTVNFLIVGYGCSTIVIEPGTGPTLPTALLDATGATLAFSTADGYFKNKLSGDANGDGIIDIFDMGTLSGRWTGASGALPYSRDIDNNDDGVIDIFDMGVTSGNWGRTV